MRRLASMAPVFVFTILALGLGASLKHDPSKMPSLLLDKAVPKFAMTAFGESHMGLSNADLKGKVSLLNVFASWCSGCRAEHSMLMQLAQMGSLPIYGIAWKDSVENGEQWLKTYHNPYERLGFDESGRVGIDLGVTGVPETFVIDSSGRVRYRHEGPITDEIWRDVLEPLVAQLRRET